ncbi:MAG TPA: alpha/beta fold hydrolase [Thermomicrobiales bacterium]|nr:alpha/beta fold hydrolase [Thermomicrobiales bacterium]
MTDAAPPTPTTTGPTGASRAASAAARHAVRRLGAAGLGAGALLLATSAVMGHTITRPRRVAVLAARDLEPDLEEVTFRTADGLALSGWYLPAARPRDAVIICHGFAMSRNELLDLARGLRARDHAVLLFDFRAHGASAGDRSTIGYREATDIVAAVDFLRARPELAGRRIGVAGVSMGAAAAIQAAAREPRIAAVVADSSFAALDDVAANGIRLLYRLPRYPFAPLVIRFGELFCRTPIGLNRPIGAIGRIAPRPLLLIHCASDRLVPLTEARLLYAAAGEPKELWVVPDLDHACASLGLREDYLDRLDAFFSGALRAPEAAALAAK